MGIFQWFAEYYRNQGTDTSVYEYVVAAVVLAACFYGAIWMGSCAVMPVVKTWRNNKKRDEKRAELAVIMDNWTSRVGQTPKREAEKILSMRFDDLRSALSDGKLSPVEVLCAYQYQAASMNKLYNFICEPIREAESIAERLAGLSSEERKRLPFYGIPISVKETILMEGYETTAGCVNFIGNVSKRNSCIIQAMIDKGAVPFIRTNIPQTCMAVDSVNPIYGTTCNPHNVERSCGGSSGGEGVSLSTGSSVLGFGSDIGGSARIPAAWCGCYSIKPTAGRLSHRGDYSIDFNERTVSITVGPFAQEVDTLIECMRELSTSTSFELDPYTPPIHFNNHELSSTRPLKIGYFKELSILRSSAAAKRALSITLDILQQQGHEVVEWVPSDLEYHLPNYWIKDLFADGGKWFMESIGNDKLSVHIRDSYYLCCIPLWLKKIISFLLTPSKLLPAHFGRYLLTSHGCSNVAEFWKLEHDIREYRNFIIDELRNKEIDVIVSPAMPVPANKIGTTQDAIGQVGYMGLMNLLNFPAGIIPVTKYTSEDYSNDMNSFPNDDLWHRALRKSLTGAEGLPMAVQVASLPFHEERCLRVMKEIETHSTYKL